MGRPRPRQVVGAEGGEGTPSFQQPLGLLVANPRVSKRSPAQDANTRHLADGHTVPSLYFLSTFTVARRLPTRGADDMEQQGQRTVWRCTRRGRGRDRRVQQPREQLRDLPRGVDPGRADVRELHPRREVGAPRQAAVSAVLRPQCPVHARDMGRIWDPVLAFSSQTSGFTSNRINPKKTSSFPSALHIQIMLQTESHQKKQNNFWNIPG